MTLKSATLAGIKRVPGVKWLHRTFVRTPGGWIFSSRRLQWLMAGAAYRALPPLFRVFVRYCRIAPETRRGSLLGAELVHHFVSFLTRLMRVSDACRITTGPYVVHLHVTDPRSLVVPNEILNSVETRFLKERLREGDTFVDVGSNHGSFSIVASKLVGSSGRIIAVEPQPRLAELVARSLSENCSCPFTVLQIACSDFEGEQPLFIPHGSSGSAGLYRQFSGSASGSRVQVRVRRFDDAVDWQSFAGGVVMKVDVEGAELSFLRGATRALMHSRPHIILEVNPFSAHAAGTSVRGLADQLRALGYDSFRELDDPAVTDLTLLDASRSRNVVLVPRGRSRPDGGPPGTL